MSFLAHGRAFSEASGPVKAIPKSVSAPMRRGISTGFAPRHPRLHRCYNAAVVSVVIVAFLPLMALISVALLLTQGPRIIYSGERIGKDRVPFNILKFRTLDDKKAAALTANQVLPAGSNIETPLGRFLRASRLDELPQLFNVLRGDMNLVGPRPVREAIAVIERARVPDYDRKFAVKPGLVGHSQAYMTHGTTKRIRSRYNNMLIDAPVNYGAELGLFAKVGFSVLRRAAQETLKRLRGIGPDQMAATRASQMGLRLLDVRTGISQTIAALDAETIVLNRPIALPFTHDLKVRIQLGNGRFRQARITLTPLDEIGARFAYDCKTDGGRYTIERYVLDLAVVGPARPTLPERDEPFVSPVPVTA
ncbi:sugar transferase [Donghicola mangrovi]|uniref:Sugar transferase n=1 Tax=Donghicola mangrovi TaxID=2729614 RepID=A0A850Q585_9RHOB|nr:sugar transferase [Donghicola mangrovi]NVO21735.1 sugar transferase [Donghicola mangrovi]